MSGVKYEKGQSRISNGSARIHQETLNKQVIGYLATLGPDDMDVVRIPELMNQAVGLMEVVMGDQTEEDYIVLVARLKNAKLINRDIVKGLLTSMNANPEIAEKFISVWDSWA